MTKAIGLALASKWHNFGWRPTRRPGTWTGPKYLAAGDVPDSDLIKYNGSDACLYLVTIPVLALNSDGHG